MDVFKTEELLGYCDYVGYDIRVLIKYQKYDPISPRGPFAAPVNIICEYAKECKRTSDKCPLMAEAHNHYIW